MKPAYYLDTRFNAPGWYSCPPLRAIDYKGWLQERYDETNNGRPSPFEQQVNSMLRDVSNNGIQVFAIGRFAGQAAAFIEEKSGFTIEVGVI